MTPPDHARQPMQSEADSTPVNTGVVAAVRGSVVDIHFDDQLPSIYTLLHAMEGEISIEVLAQLNAHRVRGIALTPTQGLARGMIVESTGGPLKGPIGKKILSGARFRVGHAALTMEREQTHDRRTKGLIHE